MKKETIDFLLSVLYTQQAFTRQAYARKAPKIERERQEAYTDGIKTALEILVTEGYTQEIPKEYKDAFIPCVYKVPAKK